MNSAILDKASLVGGKAATRGVRAADVKSITTDPIKARTLPPPLISAVPRLQPRRAGRGSAALQEGVSRSRHRKAA